MINLLTLKVGLGSQVRDAEPKNGELVQLGQDALLEGQQRGQGVQLLVESLSVPLRRVRLGVRVFAANGTNTGMINSSTTVSLRSLGFVGVSWWL